MGRTQIQASEGGVFVWKKNGKNQGGPGFFVVVVVVVVVVAVVVAVAVAVAVVVVVVSK